MTQLKVKTNLRAGMKNPASENCINSGGKWSSLNLPSCGGEVGLCLFDDGKICEEWALMRGECQGPMPLVTTPH
ncbi:MAG: DUF333 domain-containing protein [Chloroflexota bacterium]|jgi:putative hemolysin